MEVVSFRLLTKNGKYYTTDVKSLVSSGNHLELYTFHNNTLNAVAPCEFNNDLTRFCLVTNQK